MEKGSFARMIEIIKYTMLIPILIVLIGCEDDPLLAPQTEDECTGSYCNLSLPGSGHDDIEKANPETF